MCSTHCGEENMSPVRSPGVYLEYIMIDQSALSFKSSRYAPEELGVAPGRLYSHRRSDRLWLVSFSGNYCPLILLYMSASLSVLPDMRWSSPYGRNLCSTTLIF
ncbi:hypothetical protein ARMSODRAFT_717080 [Armillaria solidipes]|uniref:Uncharacterized protein n=1 Tax=Armillaria solidipes TaxID=1076256 RepID=A0A2H3C481_9AGAR|nr:hypothetical protein ARMSODRAFT_717080 [Armillaria solidipes]